MSGAVAAVMAQIDAAAKSAQQQEEALRKRMAEEIGRLERRRTFAFRRKNLMQMLAAAAPPDAAEEKVLAAQRRALREELGWERESEAQAAILDRLQPVGRLLWLCACGAEDSTPEAVLAELESFESWFDAEHGTSFYALFDQYVPEVPVVDF